MSFRKQNQILTRNWLLMLESICIKAPKSHVFVVRMCLELSRWAERRLKAAARPKTPEVVPKVLLEGLMRLLQKVNLHSIIGLTINNSYLIQLLC